MKSGSSTAWHGSAERAIVSYIGSLVMKNWPKNGGVWREFCRGKMCNLGRHGLEESDGNRNESPGPEYRPKWRIDRQMGYFMAIVVSKTWESTSLVSSSARRQLLYGHETQNQHRDHRAGSCGHRPCHSARISGTFSSKSPRG